MKSANIKSYIKSRCPQGCFGGLSGDICLDSSMYQYGVSMLESGKMAKLLKLINPRLAWVKLIDKIVVGFEAVLVATGVNNIDGVTVLLDGVIGPTFWVEAESCKDAGLRKCTAGLDSRVSPPSKCVCGEGRNRISRMYKQTPAPPTHSKLLPTQASKAPAIQTNNGSKGHKNHKAA